MLEGELTLHNGIVIRVLEVLDFKINSIRNDSYAVYREGVKVRWYDAQPHPENSDLAATFPHNFSGANSGSGCGPLPVHSP